MFFDSKLDELTLNTRLMSERFCGGSLLNGSEIFMFCIWKTKKDRKVFRFCIGVFPAGSKRAAIHLRTYFDTEVKKLLKNSSRNRNLTIKWNSRQQSNCHLKVSSEK